MASYIEQALAPGEHVIHRAHMSWFYSPWTTIILLILALPTLGISLLLLVPTWITVKTTEMAVTNKRIMIKRGLISRHTVEMALSRLESVQVNQDILGRIFDFGTVVLSGAGNPQAPLIGIKNPLKFRAAVLSALDNDNSSGHDGKGGSERGGGKEEVSPRVVHIPVPPLPRQERSFSHPPQGHKQEP